MHVDPYGPNSELSNSIQRQLVLLPVAGENPFVFVRQSPAVLMHKSDLSSPPTARRKQENHIAQAPICLLPTHLQARRYMTLQPEISR